MKNIASGATVCVITTLLTSHLQANDWPQWRGPNRDGISQETGLLKEWPKEGPRLKWQADKIGSGYSTPSIVGDRLYILANEGVEKEFVEAISTKDGKQIWRAPFGKVGNPQQQPSFPAARSTPTVEGDLLYALGSDGDLVCAEIKAGKIRWQKNLRTDFGGKPGEWAYSESPLLDGEALVCAPGGDQAALVALNKKDGSVIWKSAIPGGDEAAYSSTIVVNAAGKKQYVQILKKGLTGVDAKTGKLLWRYQKMSSKYGANIPSPLASGDLIFSAGAGTGGGTVKLKSMGTGGIEAEEIYFSPKLPTAIGGAIKSGPVVYGTTAQGLECFDFANGEVKWQEKALGAAALCLADGNLYLHGENGEVALVQAAPDAYHEKGRFTPPNQPKRSSEMEKAWTYPVVANGQLYIRDHNMLWCYDVKK